MTVVGSSKTHPLYSELVSITAQERVNDNPVIISAYSQDACHLKAERPGIVVMPNTVEEIQAIVKLCSQTKTPLVPTGGRSGICGAYVCYSNIYKCFYSQRIGKGSSYNANNGPIL